MATKKIKDYTLGFRITRLEINVEVKAESLEEAISKGKEMKMREVLDKARDYTDWDEPSVWMVWEDD